MAYHECDCPYHYDEYGCQAPGECPNEGTIKVPGCGWLCQFVMTRLMMR